MSNMQYITAFFLWTGIASSYTVGTIEGKATSGKSNLPANAGLFFHNQAASGSAAGDPSGQPSAPVFGLGSPAYASAGVPAFSSAYGARAAAQAPSFGTSLGAGYHAQGSSGFSGFPAGAPAGYASSSGFAGAPANHAMSSSGPGGAPTGYSGEASNSGSGSLAAFASSSGFAGAPAAYASSSGFGAASAGQISSSDGAPSSGYGANPVGLGAYASSANEQHTLGSPNINMQHGLLQGPSGFSGRNQPLLSPSHEGPLSVSTASVPGGLPQSSGPGLSPISSGAGQYGSSSFASAANPSSGGTVHGLNTPQGSSPLGYASSGFAPAPQASFSLPRGIGQYGSGPPQFKAGLGRFGTSPSGVDGLKQIFKPYNPLGYKPGYGIPSAPMPMPGQRKSDAKKPIASNSNRFASSGRAKASSGANLTGVPLLPALKLKNPSRSLVVKKDLSRKKSRKNKTPQ